MAARPEATAYLPGPLVPKLGAPLAWLVAACVGPVYQTVITNRNLRFDAGETVVSLPVPVISVGNLSMGGTGKTPTVAKLVRELVAIGVTPCIAMRGYVKPQRGGGGGAASSSDEADEYRRAFPDLPIVAQADRTAGVRALLDAGRKIDCVVLDDGFQHRRLARNLDIVLIDAARNVFNDRLLPAGWLREPTSSLRRAGVVVITHAELVSPEVIEHIRERVRAVVPGAVQGVARHAWTSLMTEEGELPMSWLEGKTAVVACAIGNPEGFRRAAARACRIAGELILPDHDPYSRSAIERLLKLARDTKADAILTTEKDWSKLRASGIAWPCPVVRPQLDIVFDQGWAELMSAVQTAIIRPRVPDSMSRSLNPSIPSP